MSPLLRTAEVAGMIGLRKKRTPNEITLADFFNKVEIARSLFAQLIGASDPQQCVVIPSTSYALANAVWNIPLVRGQKVIIVDQIFPSNYYCWEKRVKEIGAEIEIIKSTSPSVSGSWSDLVLNAIDRNTQVVNISHIHWVDGSLFDLKAIAEKVHTHGGYLIVDGTQSIGALPFDLNEIGADVVFAASYKWLLGPYSIGMAYYNDRFQNGNPIEESWLNRVGSDDFANLVNYQEGYRKGALRYEVGEAPNFILLPMMIAGMQQLLEWSPQNIQDYCHHIVSDALNNLRSVGYRISNQDMAYHLFGIRLPKTINIETIKKALAKENIMVSYRGDAIRVSPSIYNDESDMKALEDILTDLAK
ncbi:MAG: selenocysteine lyase/cysteine desulfurase [Saprospiraceae bacterium]|jgi:selenocysteine lyase/cysteine desulfurase